VQLADLKLDIKGLSLEQKTTMEEKLAQMPPEQALEMKKRLEGMSADQVKAMLEKMSSMSPEERNNMRDKIKTMSPEEKVEMSRKMEMQKVMQEKMALAQKDGKKKAKDFQGTFKRLMGYVGKFKIPVIIAMICAVLSTCCNLLTPMLLANVLNALQNKLMNQVEINFNRVFYYLCVLSSYYILYLIFTLIQSRLMTYVAQNTLYKMRTDVDAKMMKLPLSYFDKTTRGDILSRVTNDIDNIGTSLQQIITNSVVYALSIIGSIGFMFYYNVPLTFVCILTIPLSLVLLKKIMKKSQLFFREQMKSTGGLNGLVEEDFSGMNVIKAFGYEQTALDNFSQYNEDMYKSSRKAQFFSGILNPVSTIINNLAYTILGVFGSIAVINGSLSLGGITALIQYQKQYSNPVSQLMNMINTLQSAIASAERVFELLDEEEEYNTQKEGVVLENVKGNIQFEQLQFGYTKDKLLMNGLNISIKAGQKIAIVGPTGAGKTTLVNLLMRFYDTSGGKITIDGINVQDVSRSDVRKTFGMVLQDTWLFHGSVKDNICYGKDTVTEEELLETAKASQIDFFIHTMPNGYDTLINEDGSNISQGQKQLLTIARAMIANPAILILDEATSSVDTRTEQLIQKAMNKLMEGRTSFVIAHRLSTIKDADLILVMKDGNIVEQGTHDSLMEEFGLYSELYNSQFSQKDRKEMTYFDFEVKEEMVSKSWEDLFRNFTKETGIFVRRLSAPQMQYEKELFKALRSDESPALFKVRSSMLPYSPTLQEVCMDLSETTLYKKLLNKDYAMKVNQKPLSVPFMIESLGLIYNGEILEKYFQLPDKEASAQSIHDIKNFTILKAVVEDLTKHKSQLGIKGVFPTCAFAKNEDHQWKTHLMAMSVYYEMKQRNLDKVTDFQFIYRENQKQLLDLIFTNNCGSPADYENFNLQDSNGQFARGESVFTIGFSWLFRYMGKRPDLAVKEENLGMLPLFFGTKYDEEQNLCLGDIWQYAINEKASPEEQDYAKEFLNWYISSPAAHSCIEKLEYTLPYEGTPASNNKRAKLDMILEDYLENRSRNSIGLHYKYMPNGPIRDEYSKNILAYAKGEQSWDEVANSLCKSWITAMEQNLVQMQKIMDIS
jgi:ATP-binding cassette, subfamily B, multidrug efflux pump